MPLWGDRLISFDLIFGTSRTEWPGFVLVEDSKFCNPVVHWFARWIAGISEWGKDGADEKIVSGSGFLRTRVRFGPCLDRYFL